MKDKILGRTLGGYKIVKPLGIGGMATVYKAFDPQTERHVAIKILPEYYAQYPEFRIRFEREAKSIAQLEHLHILPIFTYGEEDDITYIVMRYLDGGTLTKYIRKHDGLPLTEAHRILAQIAKALDYAHDQGVLHRDVKPTNILFDNRNNAILTDFGVAKMLESDHPDLTATGGIVGTPKYMSPEQCQGRKDLTPASDQYSLGIVLYEMVTGNVPFKADTPLAIIQQHLTAPLPLPSIERSDLPSAAEAVIIRALARSPHDRYANCADLAEAFGIALQEQEISNVEQVILHDTQPSIPLTLAGQTLAGNTLSSSTSSDNVPSTPSPPLISHPASSDIALPRPKSTSFIWWVGMLMVALLVGGGIYLGLRTLTAEESAPDTPTEVSSPVYVVGETLWSSDETILSEQEFVDDKRFWETTEDDTIVIYRTSGSVVQDVIYLGENEWENYQINIRFRFTSSFSIDSFTPLVELRLNSGENDAYVLAYSIGDEQAMLHFIRQSDCKEISACEILASTAIEALTPTQLIELEYGIYADTLYLTWQTENAELITLTATDENPLSAGKIGLIVPSGQVFLYEQIDVFELVISPE